MKASTLIKQHPVSIFFVLAFVISWGFVLVVAGPGKVPIDPEASADLLPFLYVTMLLGPALAGILMTGLADGKEGLRKLFACLGKWRVPVHWYAAALLLTPLLAIIVLLLLSLFSPAFQPAFFHSFLGS